MFSDFPITQIHVKKMEQLITDLKEIIERDKLGNNQVHTDYGMFSYEL